MMGPVKGVRVERRQFLKGAAAGALGGAALTGGGLAWAGRHDRTSYAAMGEDLVTGVLLRDVLKIATPTYLDIGAADPVAVNNTYMLYRQGSHGVLVEPNPTYVDRLRKVRPRDVVVAAGIGIGEAREADYYVFTGNPWINTFSPETAEFRQKNGDELERVVKMPLVPVMAVIDEHFTAAPDLLSIDAEGLDLDIVRSIDLAKYRPAVICAETKGASATHESTPLAQYLIRHGYFVTAGSLTNTILIDRTRLQA